MDRETGEVVGVRCGSWRCPICSVSNRKAFIKRLIMGLAQDDTGERPKLLTLTAQPGEAPWETRAKLTRRFEYFRVLLARKLPGARVDGYSAVVEQTKAGALHLHVVVRGLPFVPQPTLSRWASRAGFGRVFDVREVRTRQGMALYLVKDLGGYLTKQADGSWAPHFRRIRFSRGWALAWVPRASYRPPEDSEGHDWTLLRVVPWSVALREMAALGKAG